MIQDNQILTQGQNYQGGIVNYDSATGNKLNVGQQTTASPLNNTITPNSLAPVKPLVLPTVSPVSTANATQDYIGSTTNAIKTDAASKLLAEQQATKDNTGSTLKTTLDSILGTNTDIANVGNTIDRTAQDIAKKQSDQYTSQIEAEQLANRRAIEDLTRNNPGGLSTEQLNGKINNLNRESVSKQADLAILQNAANRNYDTASAIADRQLQLKLEPLKAKLDNLKFFYEQNKADFNKADDRLYADMVKKADAELKKKEDEEKAKTELIKNAIGLEAPSSVLSKAQEVLKRGGSLIEVAGALGSYSKDIDMELKKSTIAKNWADAKKNDVTTGVLDENTLKKIDGSPQGKKLVSLSGLYQKSQTYKNLVDAYGFKATGKDKTILDNAYADLKIAWKEAANLGALTGPDVGLIEEAVKPSSGATNYLNYKLSGGKGGVSAGIDQALTKARNEAVQNYKQLTSRNPNYKGSDYVRGLISPFAKNYNTVDISVVPVGEIIETEDGVLLEALGNGNFSPL